MEVQNNPAGRLHDILTAATKANTNSPLRVVWGQALGCGNQDSAELMRLWSELIGLTREAKAAIKNLEDLDETLFLAPFTNIEALLTKVNFDQRWNEVKAYLNPETMLGLRYGADRLKREGGGTTQLNIDQVTTLTGELDTILERVLDSDLPHKLKQLFVRNLEQLRQALLCLRLSGAEGLEQEIDRVLGSLLRHKDDLAEAAEDGQNKKLIKDLFGLLSNFNETVTSGQNMLMLAGPVIALLGHSFT